MAIYEFPHTRNYEQPIDQLILELTKKVEELGGARNKARKRGEQAMSYFDFPHARNYDSDLSFLIDEYQRLLTKVEELIGKIDEGDVATLQDLNNAIAPILQQIQELNEVVAPISQQITQLQSSIPTKTSQLTNDSDFVTTASVNTAISSAVNPITQQLQAVEGSIPTTTNQLTNNSNFIVGASVANIVVESGSHTGSDSNTLYFVLEA